jgi:ribosome biogenesis protein MAK21
LQNESIDDELEHFEDVVEETDEKPVAVSNKPSGDILPVQNGDTANSDTDSSENEDDQLASSEDDDDDLDDALEDGSFSLEKSKTKHKKSKSESDDEDKKTQESAKKPVLPGGYDP